MNEGAKYCASILLEGDHFMRRAIVSMGTLLLLCAVSQAKEPATQPGDWANAIDATDVAAIKKTVGSNVLVKGKVVRAQWSVSGKVMRAEFGNKPDELVLIIFSSKKDDMDKAF
ncbi:MAG TPA: hypothetical protein VG733_02235, partial [Chthoniobacteraceae bacterium]|nr:hypothetical protein [Chthoniobacteraceae bacterium]